MLTLDNLIIRNQIQNRILLIILSITQKIFKEVKYTYIENIYPWAN